MRYYLEVLIFCFVSLLYSSAQASSTPKVTLYCPSCSPKITIAVLAETRKYLNHFSITAEEVYSLKLEVQAAEEDDGRFKIPEKRGNLIATEISLEIRNPLASESIFPILYHELGHLIAFVFSERVQLAPPKGIKSSILALNSLIRVHQRELNVAYRLRKNALLLENRSTARRFGHLSEQQLSFINEAYEEIFADFVAAVYSGDLEEIADSSKDIDRGFSGKVSEKEFCSFNQIPKNVNDEHPMECETHSALAYLRPTIGRAFSSRPTISDLENLYFAFFKSMTVDFEDGATGNFSGSRKRIQRLSALLNKKATEDNPQWP